MCPRQDISEAWDEVNGLNERQKTDVAEILRAMEKQADEYGMGEAPRRKVDQVNEQLARLVSKISLNS